ncbi:sodium:proton antiporter [Pseudonocardia sp. RS11V-5]|uniref:MnhB domain-containing protein n=1 Tax=Pseudonocardia terrae TaxID=2905831 RepID=UPI001E406F9E|nr:MnhB domain-containing protein [Pseudonocardia terrae]MCE3553271.1 sodium:proton antiporter [Pseudonocardia terrae]
MTRRVRLIVFAAAAAAVGVLLVVTVVGMPPFGNAFHPYRDVAVAAAIAHQTANVVSGVNYDLRAFDTLGEETILLGSVVGAAVLLRPGREERERTEVPEDEPPLQAVRLVGYLLLPVTLVLGLDVVAHGHLTPGGGFQGGVVLGTGLHLLYLAGGFRALERLRAVPPFEVGEAVGTAAFVAVGIAGLAVTGSFLANVLPLGTFGSMPSSGIVPLLNVAVGMEVASGVILLLAHFLDQALRVERR